MARRVEVVNSPWFIDVDVPGRLTATDAGPVTTTLSNGTIAVTLDEQDPLLDGHLPMSITACAVEGPTRQDCLATCEAQAEGSVTCSFADLANGVYVLSITGADACGEPNTDVSARSFTVDAP